MPPNFLNLRQLPKSYERLDHLTMVLDNFNPTDWDDLVNLLGRIKIQKKALLIPHGEDALKFFARGTAFITFSYGIDGVSVEMSKYAHTLNDLFKHLADPSIHFIGGDFQPQVSSLLDSEWHKFQVDGIDGWNKWDDGKWFKALFRKKMESYEQESNLITKEIYQQAVLIAKQLGKYFIDNQISLVVPVNVASNPGNIALTLGLVLVTEILGMYVLNSNHDFYWESGKPISERELGEKPGIRDHFFKNINNKTFFSLLKMLYPWNGKRWLQANINGRQSRKLIKKFGFPKEKIFDLPTCISETFFETYSKEDVINVRLRMGLILSAGNEIMRPVPIDNHLSEVDQWMKNQQPIILGTRPGLSVNPRSKDLIILLQPTRIVSRKRIEKNLELIGALFHKTQIRDEFEKNPNRQLILHITGPVPIEHKKDLEKVLFAYKKTISSLPEILADQIFLAFSVGNEFHVSFSNHQFQPLTIESIYRMADVVVFPSETEGRGLPIIESSAIGIPIICSKYHPREVFGEVIGQKLPKVLQILYILFPEGKLNHAFLTEVANLLIHPAAKQMSNMHNKEAVRARFSQESFKNLFRGLLIQLYKQDQGV